MAAAPMSEGVWIFMGRFAGMVAFMDIYGYRYGYAHQYSLAGDLPQMLSLIAEIDEF